MSGNPIDKASEHFKKLLENQLARIKRMEQGEEKTNYSELDTLNIGIIGGDGIGPFIEGHILTSVLNAFENFTYDF